MAAHPFSAQPGNPQLPPASTPPGGRHTGRHRASSSTTVPLPAPTSGSSRNLTTALLVGLGMAAVAVVPLLVYRRAFLLVIAVAVVAATVEVVRAVEHSGAHPPLTPLLIGGVGSVPLVWLTGPEALVIVLVVTVIAVMLWRLPEGPVGYARDTTSATLVASYVPLLAGFVTLLLAPIDGGTRVLALLAVVVASDVGGYAVGSFIGKHRMAPTISPGKTWEGTAGSLALAGLTGMLIVRFALDAAWWQGAVFGVAVAAAAIAGDLAESLIKRDVGVKDMGNILPGHGGVMDRFDSILFAAPVAYLLLMVWVPV